MTEKRFKLAFEDYEGWAILDTTGEYSDDEDYIDWLSGQKAVDVLNHFAEENEQLQKDCTALICSNQEYRKENEHLKQILNELSDMLQFDVENGIRSYPVKLSEYLCNALKELQE